MPRLRRSDPGSPGLARRPRGASFEVVDEQGRVVDDPAVLERVDALGIPPAWKDVWICPDPMGHVQATGMDAAGRKQYRYHPKWNERQSRRKFADMEAFARTLPALREAVAEDLERDDMSFDRVVAAMVRLLDRGFFRIGCEEYAEKNLTYGLATMRKEHVRLDGDVLRFDFPAKHGRRRIQHVVDLRAAEVVATCKRRRGGGPELFAYRDGPRSPWRDVKSAQVNAYLKDRTGLDVSAKDFRTWNATVLAAVSVAVAEGAPGTKSGRKRAIKWAVDEVARYLGNTPAVARASYIDPRVFDRFNAGTTIRPALSQLGETFFEPGEPATQGAVEAAVLDLIGADGDAFLRDVDAIDTPPLAA